MSCLFLEYPKCSTCRKAKKFLQENNVNFNDRDITIENPTVEELEKWIDLSGLEIKKFFNRHMYIFFNFFISINMF